MASPELRREVAAVPAIRYTIPNVGIEGDQRRVIKKRSALYDLAKAQLTIGNEDAYSELHRLSGIYEVEGEKEGDVACQRFAKGA